MLNIDFTSNSLVSTSRLTISIGSAWAILLRHHILSPDKLNTPQSPIASQSQIAFPDTHCSAFFNQCLAQYTAERISLSSTLSQNSYFLAKTATS